MNSRFKSRSQIRTPFLSSQQPSLSSIPRGTQNPADGKEMTIERKQLESIGAGELVNIEMKARVFGEENDEKEIRGVC
jgi:hypothetical protein